LKLQESVKEVITCNIKLSLLKVIITIRKKKNVALKIIEIFPQIIVPTSRGFPVANQ